MSGFTKLVPEIVLSSIWNEPPEIRCVWITLIATKDRDGNVRGNPRSLARIANVPIEAVNQALALFQEPDVDSNNQELEGRRIEAIPGGWHIVSHAAYRAKDYTEHEAERKRIYREKLRMSGTCPGQVPDCSVSVSVSASESGPEGGCKGGKRGDLLTFGEFKRVKLSQVEYDKLASKHGKAKADAGIAVLDAWMEGNGKRRKNHYACLNETSFVWGKVDTAKPRTGYTPPAEYAT